MMATQTTFKKIIQEMCLLALPMTFTQVITVGSGFISMALLSHLGHDVLAASALIFSARISILIIGTSILFSLSILIGHAYGEKNYLRIGNMLKQGWFLGLVLSIPVMFMFWNMDTVLLQFGQPQSLAIFVKEFFHANIWNVLPFYFCVGNQQLLYGTGKQKIDLVGNILGVIFLLVSSYLLIFGKFGFPNLGVAGLGYAMSLQAWAYFIFTSVIIYCNSFFKKFQIFNFKMQQSFADLKHLFKIGWPICVQIGGEMLSFMMTATMVGWLGVQPLAAYQIVMQYLFLIIVPIFSLSQATGILIGKANGEKNYNKIQKIGYAGMVFTLIIVCIAGIIFLTLPKELAGFYLNTNSPMNAGTLHLVIILFAIVALQSLVDSLRNIITGALRGVFDTRFPMVIGLIALWVIGIPAGYLLAFNYKLGVAGIILGSTLGMLMGLVVLAIRWHRLTKKFRVPDTISE